MWIIVAFIDNIIKLFQYAWFIVVPIILLIIFLFIKKIKLKKKGSKNFKSLSITLICLIAFLIISLLTVRIWGPIIYKNIIRFSITNKEKIVEKKLEEKYKRKFSYISQGPIIVDENSGDTLGQDINGDYSVRYIFKDEDGVPAIVEYKKNYQSDYYESKRSKYDIEKYIYDYAKKVKFDKEFYIYVESPYELISNSNLNEKNTKNFILEKRNYDRIIFILTDYSEDNQKFITSALKDIYKTKNYVYVHEHVVNKKEFENAVNFYNYINKQDKIASSDYDESYIFNKDNQINFKHYYID